MTTQNKSTVARWVAVATAIYLVLGWLTRMRTSLGPEILDVVFLPAIYMFLMPTHVLADFGLANKHDLLLGPNIAGVIVLTALYAGLAYVVARVIEDLLIRQPPNK
jgi:hypothetical protein